MVTIDHFGPHQVTISTGTYQNGSLAVQLVEDGELYATASVFVPGTHLATGEFVFKTYSENEGLLEALAAAGILKPTGAFVTLGAGDGLPVCRLL